jgi:nitroreductase
MTGFDPDQVSRILGTQPNLVLTVICPLGYAADTPIPKMRFPEEDVIF